MNVKPRANPNGAGRGRVWANRSLALPDGWLTFDQAAERGNMTRRLFCIRARAFRDEQLKKNKPAPELEPRVGISEESFKEFMAWFKTRPRKTWSTRNL